MNYEKLENQGKDGHKSIKYLPRSMRDALLKTADKEIKHRNWTVDLKKGEKQSGIDLVHNQLFVKKVKNPDTNKSELGLAPIDHIELEKEKKKTALVFGSGTLALMLLAYVLFFKI